MKPFIRYALLMSAVVVAGGGVAMATIGRSSTPQTVTASPAGVSGQNYQAATSGRRGGGKFFAQFDLNNDGKVTRDEFNKALAQEFAQSAGASPTMSEPQFIAYRVKDLRQRTDQMFHRDDWNGDGRLSLEEYAEPERVRFEYADTDGTGIIACAGHGRSGGGARAASSGSNRNFGASAGSYGSSRGGGGRGAICKADDLNHDGQVTRAEFDSATAQEFAAAAKGGALNADQFYAIVAGHVRDSAAKMFARLDHDHDGKLTRDEFAASELRYFARMDRNNDGVITRDEIGSQRRYGATANDKPGRT